MLVFSTESGLAVPPRALFIGATPHWALEAWPQVLGWQPFKPVADAWDHAGLPRVANPPNERWPLVLVLPGKSRDETLAWFVLARDRLEPGGHLVVAMPNTAGAGRFEKELARATGTVVSLQKNKCRAFHAQENFHWNEAVFQEWRELLAPRRIAETNFVTCAGIFSSAHIDPGSRLLAEHLPTALRGRVADLGAGWGYLADAMLRLNPHITALDLFEADSRALDCARRNLRNRAVNLSYQWHDVTRGLPETYDAIVMNPPFHSGQATDVDLGAAFVAEAAVALRRGGQLFLVANRQLPYEALLDQHGLAWRAVAENSTYKLLFAHRR
jgi:16S rRNA (guanine1207-N2)-methyltransferase